MINKSDISSRLASTQTTIQCLKELKDAPWITPNLNVSMKTLIKHHADIQKKLKKQANVFSKFSLFPYTDDADGSYLKDNIQFINSRNTTPLNASALLLLEMNAYSKEEKETVKATLEACFNTIEQNVVKAVSEELPHFEASLSTFLKQFTNTFSLDKCNREFNQKIAATQEKRFRYDALMIGLTLPAFALAITCFTLGIIIFPQLYAPLAAPLVALLFGLGGLGAVKGFHWHKAYTQEIEQSKKNHLVAQSFFSHQTHDDDAQVDEDNTLQQK